MSTDIDTARTFLEAAATHSFVAAAERLNMTQTAVSARIRVLEEHLGCKLFERGKSGVRLTTAGERFQRYATTLVQVWERARQHVALPSEKIAGVSLGVELSLWDPLLTDWLSWLRRTHRDVAARVEVTPQPHLLEAVKEGRLDACVVHDPPPSHDLACELLADEQLVLVASSGQAPDHFDERVYVDWGPSFAVNYAAAYSSAPQPAVSVNFGPAARAHVLSFGGSGYFRLGSIRRHLESGSLRIVPGAPKFSYSIYLVYSAHQDCAEIELIREGLAVCMFDEPIHRA